MTSPTNSPLPGPVTRTSTKDKPKKNSAQLRNVPISFLSSTSQPFSFPFTIVLPSERNHFYQATGKKRKYVSEKLFFEAIGM